MSGDPASAGDRVAGVEVVAGERSDPVPPVVGEAVLEPDVRGGQHRLAPRPDRRRRVGGLSIQLLVALAKEAERVVVVAEPHVESVLLDAAVRTSAAGSLAAEAESALVDGDRLELALPTRFAESPGRASPPPSLRRGWRPCDVGAGSPSEGRRDEPAPGRARHRTRRRGSHRPQRGARPRTASPRMSWRSSAMRSSKGRAPCWRATVERLVEKADDLVALFSQVGSTAQGLRIVEAHSGGAGQLE